MKEGPGARRGRRWATQPALRPQGKESLLSRTAVAPAVCVPCPLAQNQKSPTRLLPRLSVCCSGWPSVAPRRKIELGILHEIYHAHTEIYHARDVSTSSKKKIVTHARRGGGGGFIRIQCRSCNNKHTRDGQTSSHRPRLVVSRSTCAPFPPTPPLANSFERTRYCSNKHTHTHKNFWHFAPP